MDYTANILKKEKTFDVNKIRSDFPILNMSVHGKPLAFLDNAASSQKPQSVISAIENYYKTSHSNIHRGVYYLSQVATEAYENSRKKVKIFLNASSEKEIVFVRGTTEGINLVANTLGRKFLNEGDEVIISEMEHHSNIVPWQILRDEKKIKLRIIPINEKGELILDNLDKLISSKTKLISITHVSNSLGTINPVREIIQKAHSKNIPVLLDGAQAVPHLKVDVQDLDCDFYTFSGHKVYGPTGIGVLYGKEKWLEKLPPYQGGGDMIKSVTFEKTTYNDLPYKFEAGTPDIAGVIGLSAALDYVEKISFETIKKYEQGLLNYATSLLSEISGLRFIGTAKEKASVVSFELEGVHPHDVGQFLDNEGIAVRTGHHCTQPVMDRFNVPATTRASFSFYNTKEEIKRMYDAVIKVKEIFA